MDTPEGFISAIILTAIGSPVLVKIVEFIIDSIKGRVKKRQAEVDKMAELVTAANLRADNAEAALVSERATAAIALDAALRRARVGEEVVVELRMLLLSTGKFSREQIPDIEVD